MEDRFSFCECLLQCLHKLLEKNLEASLEHVHLSGPGASGRQHAVIEKLGAQQSPEVCRDQFPYSIKSTHPPLPIYDTLVTGMGKGAPPLHLGVMGSGPYIINFLY